MLVPKSVVRSKKEREREREYMSRFPTFILSSCEDFVNRRSTVLQQAECLRFQPSPDNPEQIPQWACRIQELCRSKTPKSLISSSMKHRSIPMASSSFPAMGFLWKFGTPTSTALKLTNTWRPSKDPGPPVPPTLRRFRSASSASPPAAGRGRGCAARSTRSSAASKPGTRDGLWGGGQKGGPWGFWEVGETNHLWGIMVDEWYEWIDNKTKDVSVDYDLVEVSDGVEKLQVLQYRQYQIDS